MSILPTSGPSVQAQNGDLPAAITLDWDTFYGPGPTDPVEPPTRAAFRQAIAAAATTLRAQYPQLTGRITSAVKIVLAGDIEPGAGGKFIVGSQADAGLHYVIDGECACKDADRPEVGGRCKHVLATAIFQQAYVQTAQTLVQRDAASCSVHQTPGVTEGWQEVVEARKPMEHPTPSPQAPTRPEASYSASFKAIKHGFEVQITIRKAQSEEFLQTLATMPQWLGEHGYQPTRGPVPPPEAPAPQASPAPAAPGQPAEGWCNTHGVQMTRQSNAKGSWWSHKTPEGWCKGK